MSLIVYNGSPRGKRSNSTVIINWFLEGCDGKDIPIYYLNKTKQHQDYAKEMVGYNDVLIVFPLYVDGMPGQVKNFFEVLSKYKSELKDKHVTYIIHSGFSEAIQNRALERYLYRFSSIMEFNNHGVIIIPGSEGFRLMPPNMTRKKRLATVELSVEFISGVPYSEDALQLLRGKETLSPFGKIVFRILSKTGLTNFYWNKSLKSNMAYDKRFDAPYADKPTEITGTWAISVK